MVGTSLVDFWKRFFAVSLGLIIALLLVEGIARIRQRIKYGTVENTVSNLKFDPVSGLFLPIAGTTTGAIRINALGFRSPELDVPKPAGRIRLAFLGASTTFCAEVSSNEATWPHLVWKTLQDTWPNLQFDYVNAAIPGCVVLDSLRNLEYRVKPLQPDIIVIYEAVNDLASDTRRLAQQQGLWAEKPEDPSFLARWSLVWFLIEKNWQIVMRQKAADKGAGRLVFDPQTLSSGFHTRLRALVEASEQVAPVVAVATFAHKFRREQSHEEQLRAANISLYYMPSMTIEGLLKGFEEYNRVIREVAQETGAILIEGEHTIPGDDLHFNDSIHFKDAGAILMAQRVTKTLMQSELLKKLIGSRVATVPGQ
jgi:lysophospholipase L1-like esterase